MVGCEIFMTVCLFYVFQFEERRDSSKVNVM